MNRADDQQQGFTIIELLLAMTFVSVLLLTIAVTVIQISNVYNKGLTMKAVDQAGRALSLDIRQTLAASQPFNTDTAFRLQQSDDGGGEAGGRLCTGLYSYIWNFGRNLSTDPASASPVNKYRMNDSVIRFVRVRDTGGQYCADIAKQIEKDDATELLSGGDRDVALQSFSIVKLAEDPTVGQALYRIVMQIGTNNQEALEQVDGEELNTMDTACKPPSDDDALQDYCAVNKFDFTVQAGNKGGE